MLPHTRWVRPRGDISSTLDPTATNVNLSAPFAPFRLARISSLSSMRLPPAFSWAFVDNMAQALSYIGAPITASMTCSFTTP